MKIINASYQIMFITPDALQSIEESGRVCYKSEDRITNTSSIDFVHRLIESQHESVLEHAHMKVRFIVDRGISHELVRHRIASFSQESTRYCNYSKGKFGNEITVIKPCFWPEDCVEYSEWRAACLYAEKYYLTILSFCNSPQEARSVLPNSLKTEIDMTTNLREWRHVFKLRTSPKAHPQMREVMVPLLAEVKRLIPVIFEDL